MPLKSTSAFGRWQKAAWPVVRLFVPRETRWFAEGHPKIDGQLWVADRKLLYDTVRARAPKTCFEIGTWKGGGSTLFIAQALFDNGSGRLHTIELDNSIAAEARRAYETHLPHLLPYVVFHTGDYREQYRRYLAPDEAAPSRQGRAEAESGELDARRAHFVFLDGPEDARETLAQYEFFAAHLQAGSALVVHDWLTDKARLVRDLLEHSRDWRIEQVLLPPRSVGCALAIRV